MCGRFTLTIEIAELQKELGLSFPLLTDWNPRYNIAPSQQVSVVLDGKTRSVASMRWGLIPFWVKANAGPSSALINARAESIGIKPSFRESYKKRRCLVLADGFYEWKHVEGKKSPSIPFYFCRVDRKPFLFAGIWDSWKPANAAEENKGFAIITCEANGVVKPIHERMPVMLDAESGWMWLDDTLTSIELDGLLSPYPEDKLDGIPVNRVVYDVNRDDESCIRPQGDQLILY